ncbi:ComEC/Rec2 family competence protein, partial [Candidatus Fermentibacterales bacterium]|nr:ComEC/Rec2 family competence protein [Candidatus Fermentibacterales bacterium]
MMSLSILAFMCVSCFVAGSVLYAVPAAGLVVPVLVLSSVAAALLQRRTCSRAFLALSALAAGSSGSNLADPETPRHPCPGFLLVRSCVNEVTGRGALLETAAGTAWVPGCRFAGATGRGDSLLVLLSVSGRGFCRAVAWRSTGSSSSWVEGSRAAACSTLAARVPSRQAAGLAMALLVGERSRLPESVRSAFRESGAFHLIAVSGFHVSLVSGIVYLALRRVAAARGIWLALCLCVAVWGYALFTGGRPSALRAASMVCFFVSAREVSGRNPSGITVWSLAAAVVLLLDPAAARDRAAWMSFLAVLSLLVASGGLLRRGRSLPGSLAAMLGAGLVATFAIAPVLAELYGCVRVLGPLATVVSMLFLLPVMTLGLLALLPVLWPAAS